MRRLWIHIRHSVSSADRSLVPAAAGVVLFYAVLARAGIGCPIRFLSGISCAGCGMSRAWLSLLRGDFAAAAFYHPLFWLPPLAGSCLASARTAAPEACGLPGMDSLRAVSGGICLAHGRPGRFHCGFSSGERTAVPELENCPEIFEKIRLAWTEVPGYRRRRVFCVPAPLF